MSSQDKNSSSKNFLGSLDAALFFEIIVENSKLLAFSTDTEGKTTYVNSAWQRVSGEPPDRLIREGWQSILHPEDSILLKQEYVKFLKEKSDIRKRFRLMTKDGSYRWYESHGVPCFDFGKFIGHLGFCYDVDSLVQTQERMALAMQAVGFGAWEWDFTNKKFDFDDHIHRIHHLERGEYRDAEEFCRRSIHPGDLDKFFDKFESSMSSGEPFEIIYRVVDKAHNIHWIESKAKVMKNAVGRPISIVGSSWDITHEMIARAEKEKSELALHHASKMATLGEMSAGVAHEINNPLMIIKGKMVVLHQLFKSDSFIKSPQAALPKVKENLTKIDETINRIAKIVKGLRTFSRNSEKDPFQKSSFKHIIQECLDLCQERFKSKHVDIKLKDIEDYSIECRSTQVIQVLTNLVNNAFDAIQNKENPWIEISAEKSEEVLIINITDCGYGISKDVAEKIMQPFFTTKDVGKGTGLGLSISKGLIEDHGGELYYDSTFPHTRFVVKLPMVQKKAFPQNENPSDPNSSQTEEAKKSVA